MKNKIVIKAMPFLFAIIAILGCGHRVVETPEPVPEVAQQPVEVSTEKQRANVYHMTPDASQIISSQVEYDKFDENFVLSALTQASVIPETVGVNSITLATEDEIRTITVDFNKGLVEYLKTLSNAAEFGTTTAIANTYLDYFNADRFNFRVNNKELKTDNKNYNAYYVKFEGTDNPEFGKFETETIVNSTNEIAKSVDLLEFFKAPEKNTVISPVMLKLELFNIYEGSEETNRQEIAKYIEDVDQTEKHILDFVNNESDNYSNSIIYHEGISGNVVFDEVYLKSIDRYKTSLRSFDFTKDNATKEANDYVNKLAFDETPNIFEKIDENASIFEVSEYNFDKVWNDDFKNSEEGIFYNSDGSESKIEFLNTVEELPYFETEDVKGFVKNYAESGYSLIAVLPKRTNVNYQSINLADVTDYYNREDKLVKISMPKLSASDWYSTQEVMRSNGINKIFTFGNANFDKMFTEKQQSFLSDMYQFNKFTIDGLVAEPDPKDKTKFEDLEYDKEVSLDQPFVFIVYNDVLDEVVLIGQINTAS